MDKVATLSLIGQQAVLSKPRADQDNVTQASFVVVSELIAKKLKPHAQGEFVECLCGAAHARKNQAVPKCQFVSENRLRLTWHKTSRNH